MATTTEQTQAEIVRQLTDPDAPAPQYNFGFAPFLKKAYHFSAARPVCRTFRETGQCPLGDSCPDRHAAGPAAPTHGTNNLVCKHWLRGLCKKGDACEFLHEYNVRRMPECTHYARSLWCPAGDECLYQHVDPASRRAQCPHYDRGFCPLGPRCAKRHLRRKLCKYYLAGFCPYGRRCSEGAHPRFPHDLPKPELHVERSPEELEAERQRIRDEAEREDELAWQGKDGAARGRGRRRGFGRGRGRF